jgi:uncharacterized protein YcnI
LKPISRVGALLSITCLMVFVAAGVAWAHVVVSPKEAPADAFQKFVVSVPTEKDIPTTDVRVEVPEGFTVTGVQPVPGWQHEFEKEGGVVRAISWSGGKINPEEFQEFAFQARTPAATGEFAWKVYQTYEDGSVVEWTGPPDSEEPASVVGVVSGGSRTDEHGAKMEGTHSDHHEVEATTDEHGAGAKGTHSEGTIGSAKDALPKSGGPAIQTIVAYAGLSLGTLVLSLMALLALHRRRSP